MQKRMVNISNTCLPSDVKCNDLHNNNINSSNHNRKSKADNVSSELSTDLSTIKECELAENILKETSCSDDTANANNMLYNKSCEEDELQHSPKLLTKLFDNINSSNFSDVQNNKNCITGSRFDPLRTFASIIKETSTNVKASKTLKVNACAVTNSENINNNNSNIINKKNNMINNEDEIKEMERVKLLSNCTWPIPNLLLHTRPPYKKINKTLLYRYLLVIDFEATCSANSINYPNEIIEFPVVVLDTKTLCVIAHFHSYVKPKRNPILSSFCKTLTGITQADVDAAPTLPEVLTKFDLWLTNVVYPIAEKGLLNEAVNVTRSEADVCTNNHVEQHRKHDNKCIFEKRESNDSAIEIADSNSQLVNELESCNEEKLIDEAFRKVKIESDNEHLESEHSCAILQGSKVTNNDKHKQENLKKGNNYSNNSLYEMFCVATDGPWDMRHFMHACSVQRDHVKFPKLFYRFINVKKCFSDYFKCKPTKLRSMLSKLMMDFVGKPHCGYDDAVNITRVMAELLARGYKLRKVSRIECDNQMTLDNL